ncbi:MAG: hypothetical protein AAB647_04505 [Patescibacteria group bacterium]
MRHYFSLWYLLGLAIVIWRIIYAYWTPLVNQFPVPPGDDPIFHTGQIQSILTGNYHFFASGYPLGFHYFATGFGRLFGWDAITTIRLIPPLLLVLPVVAIFFLGTVLFRRPQVGAFAAFLYAVFAQAPLFLFGDGGYPNLLAGHVLLPLALGLIILALRILKPVVIGLAIGVSLAIPLVHHLSTIFFLLALIPLLAGPVQQLFRQRGRLAIFFSLGLVMMVSLVSLGLWFGYQPFISGAFISLRDSGNLAGFFGQAIVAPLPPPAVMIFWHGAIFLIIALHGWLVLAFHKELTQIGNTPGVTILSRAKDTPGVKENLRKSCHKENQPAKWWLSLWIFSLLAIGLVPALIFNQRFLRELVIPLALTGGFGLATTWDYLTRWRFARLGYGLALIVLAIVFWLGKSQAIFGFPAPFEYITRVGVDEKAAFVYLDKITPVGGVIAANHGNGYLPYLVHHPVIIYRDPATIPVISDNSAITTLFITALPPLVDPVSGPSLYRNLEEVSVALKTWPDFELVKTLPSGSVIYRRVTVP